MIKLLIGLVIVALLLAMYFYWLEAFSEKGRRVKSLSKMRQLHSATMAMALDAEKKNIPDIGWPGDMGSSMENWASQLVKGGYLTEPQLCQLLSASGFVVTKLPTSNNTAMLVYAVSRKDDGNSVLFSTSNFTNTPSGGILDPKIMPYGDKVFVVFRMGGDGAILKAAQVGQKDIIGSYVPLCR